MCKRDDAKEKREEKEERREGDKETPKEAQKSDNQRKDWRVEKGKERRRETTTNHLQVRLVVSPFSSCPVLGCPCLVGGLLVWSGLVCCWSIVSNVVHKGTKDALSGQAQRRINEK